MGHQTSKRHQIANTSCDCVGDAIGPVFSPNGPCVCDRQNRTSPTRSNQRWHGSILPASFNCISRSVWHRIKFFEGTQAAPRVLPDPQGAEISLDLKHTALSGQLELTNAYATTDFEIEAPSKIWRYERTGSNFHSNQCRFDAAACIALWETYTPVKSERDQATQQKAAQISVVQ